MFESMSDDELDDDIELERVDAATVSVSAVSVETRASATTMAMA
jgi:hypothetical protein